MVLPRLDFNLNLGFKRNWSKSSVSEFILDAEKCLTSCAVLSVGIDAVLVVVAVDLASLIPNLRVTGV